jgi:hypothetical protein
VSGANVGASLTGVTVRLAVSLALLKALEPPVPPGGITTYCPAVPLLWSQARKVMASLKAPLRSPKGSRRIWSFEPSRRASSLALLLIRSARMVSQLNPPSRLYCQVPSEVFSAVMAMASTAPSGPVMLPSTTRAATVIPVGWVAPSGTLPSVGDVSFRVGASLTGGGMGSLLLLGRGMDRVAKRGH